MAILLSLVDKRTKGYMLLQRSKHCRVNTILCVIWHAINKATIATLKRVRIRSYSGPHFHRIFPHLDWIRSISPYLVRMRENAEKVWTRITPNTEAFYAVYCKDIQIYILYILYIDIHLWLSQRISLGKA